MYLKIAADNTLSLEEADDFKRFHIEGDVTSNTFKEISTDAAEERNVVAESHGLVAKLRQQLRTVFPDRKWTDGDVER